MYINLQSRVYVVSYPYIYIYDDIYICYVYYIHGCLYNLAIQLTIGEQRCHIYIYITVYISYILNI